MRIRFIASGPECPFDIFDILGRLIPTSKYRKAHRFVQVSIVCRNLEDDEPNKSHQIDINQRLLALMS